MELSRRSTLHGSALGLLGPWAALAQATAVAPVVTRDTVDRHLPELDTLAAEALRQTGVPGLSVAVVHQDRIVRLIPARR
jgi:CubicO group peptidase (beta-lactamase class C family)